MQVQQASQSAQSIQPERRAVARPVIPGLEVRELTFADWLQALADDAMRRAGGDSALSLLG